jgi:hypothetical protein
VSGYGRGAGTVGSVARSTARPMKKNRGGTIGAMARFQHKTVLGKRKAFLFPKSLIKFQTILNSNQTQTTNCFYSQNKIQDHFITQ